MCTSIYMSIQMLGRAWIGREWEEENSRQSPIGGREPGVLREGKKHSCFRQTE